MIIHLSDEEIEKAERLAKGRNTGKKNTKRNSWSKEVNTESASYLNHLLGVSAEIAVARFLDIEIDENFYGEKGDGNKADLNYKSLTIQIKSRRINTWDYALKSDKLEEFNTDIGILTYPLADTPNAIEIAGFITKSEFEQVAKIKNYKYGNRIVAEREHFKPIILFKNDPTFWTKNQMTSEDTIIASKDSVKNADKDNMDYGISLLEKIIRKDERRRVLQGL